MGLALTPKRPLYVSRVKARTLNHEPFWLVKLMKSRGRKLQKHLLRRNVGKSPGSWQNRENSQKSTATIGLHRLVTLNADEIGGFQAHPN